MTVCVCLCVFQPEEGPQVSLEPPALPSVTPEVLRTASERHQKGLMAPWVYQVLSQVCLGLPRAPVKAGAGVAVSADRLDAV